MSDWISKRQMVDKIEDLFLDKYEEKANSDLTGFFKEVLKILVNDKGQSNWISVKDRLPEKDWIYIVCITVYPHQFVFEARWEDSKWLSVVTSNQLEYITHWMPLPQKPESEE